MWMTAIHRCHPTLNHPTKDINVNISSDGRHPRQKALVKTHQPVDDRMKFTEGKLRLSIMNNESINKAKTQKERILVEKAPSFEL